MRNLNECAKAPYTLCHTWMHFSLFYPSYFVIWYNATDVSSIYQTRKDSILLISNFLPHLQFLQIPFQKTTRKHKNSFGSTQILLLKVGTWNRNNIHSGLDKSKLPTNVIALPNFQWNRVFRIKLYQKTRPNISVQ